MKLSDEQSEFSRVFNVAIFMLLAKFTKIRCTRKISVLQYSTASGIGELKTLCAFVREMIVN